MTLEARERRNALAHTRLWALVFVLASLPGRPVEAAPVRVGHVQAELIPESDAIVPGQPFWAAVRFVIDDGWHINWRNPGDAGLPPRIGWDLPAGFKALEITWPFPERIVAGPLVSFGYHGDVLLPVRLHAPAQLSGETPVRLAADVDWLVCRDVCVPGQASLTLDLSAASRTPAPDPRWVDDFTLTRSRIPLVHSEWRMAARALEHTFELTLTPPEWWQGELADVFFAPYTNGLIENASPQFLRFDSGAYRLTVTRDHNNPVLPSRLTGVLYSSTGWRGPGSEQAIEFDAAIGDRDGSTPVQAARVQASSIWPPLLFALLGGLILNLMPCVLPVLSLKVLGLVQQAGESPRKARNHGLLFALGVVSAFWVLAGVLVLLRFFGEQLGWGFQLQSPSFVTVLAGFFFLLGLSLLGVFEIGTSLLGVGSGTRPAGGGGAFTSGVTAAVVATPCTAPFMGTALGFALTQPVHISLLVFTTLGIGMALPYVVLTSVPAWLRFVPRPGRWMETLKQFMAFLLFATVLWLAWLLGQQAGAQAVIALLGMLLVLALGAWTWGRWGTLTRSRAVRTTATVIALTLIVGGIGAGLGAVRLSGSTLAPAAGGGGAPTRWEEFDPARAERLGHEGRVLFIAFTADWCLSCKVNERVALASAPVMQRFTELDAVLMKADWTRRSGSITQALAAYGRSSIPLYVLYTGRPGAGPVILPEILTPAIVLEALQQIDT